MKGSGCRLGRGLRISIWYVCSLLEKEKKKTDSFKMRFPTHGKLMIDPFLPTNRKQSVPGT